MQPLTLHLQGLHSFREAADIDLGTLGQHGLFGIFGPVGSGKSTLLDAMTLALFGQVDRLVGRSKRGIVNHQSKRCEVRLRFRARGEEWEAQRAYRADKDGVAQRIHSRLAKVEGDRLAVVADKEREVNAAIEQLLGLTAEDFMRAVVLPQGRFMQFLHLQGTDRRRMLQRIFHLEPFGEGLRARVKRETDRVGGVLQHALGELEGLGTADAESLAIAAETVKATTDEASLAEEQLRIRTAALEVSTRARAHWIELAAARSTLSTHLIEADATARAQDALEDAQRIRPILSHLQRRDEASIAADRAQTLLATANEAHDRALLLTQTTQATWKQDSGQRAADEPELERQRDTLRRASGKMTELERAVAAAQDLGRKRSQLKRKVDSGRLKSTKLEAALADLVKRRGTLRSARADLVVTVEDRHLVRAAEDARQALEQARAQVQAARDQSDAANRRCKEAAVSEGRASSALEAGLARSTRASADRDRLMAQLDAMATVSDAARSLRRGGLVQRLEHADTTLREVEQAANSAEAEQQTAQQTLDTLLSGGVDRSSLAGLLASELVDGEPCRVCGATDHPTTAPHVSETEVLSALEGQARATAELEARARTSHEASMRVAQAQSQVDGIQALVPEVLKGHDATALAALLVREEQVHGSLMHAVARTERSLEGLRPGLEDARALYIAATAHRGAAEQELVRIAAEQSEGERREGEAWGAVTDAMGDRSVFDLPRLVARIAESDKKRQQLQPELDAIDKDLDRTQRAWEDRQRLSGTQAADLERVTVEHGAAERHRSTLLEQIRESCASGDPVTELDRVQTRLADLERAEVSSREALEAARSAEMQTHADHAAARMGKQAASGALDRATEDLLAVCAAAGIDPDAPRLAERALPEIDLDERRQTLRAWFETRAVLTHQVTTLEARDLPEVSEPQHAEAIAHRERAMARWRTTEGERVRAKEQHAALSSRAERFSELQKTEQALSTRSERLRTLMRLLRGDKFVEYVANDYLTDLCAEASRHLGSLTRGRYALELDASAAFLIADLDAGGAVRPASSLSGGETFITSLALALALSTQVQQHNDQALEFFFLDEGFGSLDAEALDRVMTAIEALADGHRVIGLISHVSAVRERVPRYLSLTCPRDGGGTRVEVVDT